MGTVWKPTVGRGGSVVVRTVGASSVTALPWPPKARRNPKPTTVPLTADKTALHGYTATGQRG